MYNLLSNPKIQTRIFNRSCSTTISLHIFISSYCERDGETFRDIYDNGSMGWKGNKRKKKRVNRFEGSNPLPSIKGRSISNVDPSLNVVSAGSGTYDHLAILSQDLELLHSTITRSRRADKASSHLYADIARPQFLRASRSRFPRIKF